MNYLRYALRAMAVTLLLIFGLQSSAQAVTGEEWVIRTRSDYKKARLERTTLTPEGRIILSPAVTTLAEVPQPVIWALAMDRKGTLYAGGGNDGKVMKVASGQFVEIFDAPEVEVHALAVDAEGRLYVGASPEAKVYRIATDGESETFFEPEATYVWALAFKDDGNLLVATGQPGRIYSVSPDGQGTVLFDARDDHMRSLVADGEGGFLAGSDGGGVIYKIDKDGKTSVLFDSPEREIASLAVMDGEVFAAALSPVKPSSNRPRASSSSTVTRVRVTADGGSEVQDEEGGQQARSSRQNRARPAAKFTGAIYRITPDGYGRKIWSSTSELPLSLVAGPDGSVLAGLSAGGRILSLTTHGESSDIAFLEAEQVTVLLNDGEKIMAGTSNNGIIYEITSRYAREGTVLGEVKDAGFTSTWGALNWDADVPKGTGMAFEVRTGDTEEPDSTWSEWSSPLTEPDNSIIDRPAARFLQWKARLSSNGTDTPVLKSGHIHYLPENIPPVVSNLEPMPPGVWLQSTSGSQGGEGDGSTRGRRPAPPKRAFQRGMRSVSWQTKDDNEDPLLAAVQYRGEDETVWKTLKKDLFDSFFAWDSTAMPDGVYRIKVIVSDDTGNPPGKGLAHARVSGPFEVDNTPPVIAPVKARLGSTHAVVTTTITDTFSSISEVSYSVDAGPWIVVLPEDGVADRPRESVRFKTKELSPGEHSIVVKASDRAGNTSAGKVIITVP
jgi:sugar lactone lactonase YvrE